MTLIVARSVYSSVSRPAPTPTPALPAALHEHARARPRQVITAVLDQAVARGEIPPGRDLTLVPDVILSLNMLRLVMGKSIDQAFIRQVFEDVILPLVTAPVPRAPSQPK